MKEIGRLGGRAIPKAKRGAGDERRQTMREYLRERADPARVWAAIQAGLESENDRDRLAASKLLLGELYEPAADRERERQADVAGAKERLLHRLDVLSRRRVLDGLVEAGVIRPGGGVPFAGVVMFELREVAEWAGLWAPAPVTVTDVSCATCGKAAVRLVAEGEAVDEGPVYCATCQPAEEGVETSSWLALPTVT